MRMSTPEQRVYGGGACRSNAALNYLKFKENIERINACIVTQCLYEKGVIRRSEKAEILSRTNVSEAVSTLLDAVSLQGDAAVATLRDILRSVAEESLMLAKKFHCAVDEPEQSHSRRSAHDVVVAERREESSPAVTSDAAEKSVETLAAPPLSVSSETAAGSEEDRAQMLNPVLQGSFVMDRSTVRYEDVIGLDEAKEALKSSLAMPLRFPQLFATHHVSWNGILLFGPAGCGKTLLANAITTQVPEYRFMAVSSSNLISKYQDGRQLVGDLFELAKNRRPCIIFLDDIEVFGLKTASNFDSMHAVKAELARQMDEVCKEAASVVVLAATSVPWMLDPIIAKKFEKKVYVPLPDAQARSSIIRLHLEEAAKYFSEADLGRLGDDTKGFSAADLVCLVKSAFMAPVREIFAATHFQYARGTEASDVNGEDMLVPCSADAPYAIEMSWTVAPPEKIRERPIKMDDVVAAIGGMKRSVDDSEVALHEHFAQNNCSR